MVLPLFFLKKIGRSFRSIQKYFLLLLFWNAFFFFRYLQVEWEPIFAFEILVYFCLYCFRLQFSISIGNISEEITKIKNAKLLTTLFVRCFQTIVTECVQLDILFLKWEIILCFCSLRLKKPMHNRNWKLCIENYLFLEDFHLEFKTS